LDPEALGKVDETAGGVESGRLRVEEYAGTDSEWDGFLSTVEGSTFCHLAGWRRVMSDVMGHDTRYRVALDRRGRVVGLLPMVRVRSRLFGDYLVSMPFLSYGGPLGTPPAREVLATHAVKEASVLGVDLLELRSRAEVPGELSRSERKLTVLLELPDSPKTLWEEGLKGKVRSQVRRPLKEGMEPRFGISQLEPFYSVFARTMRELGTPVLPATFFRAIAVQFPDQVVFCAVYHREEPLAAGCGFVWSGELEITWAGALREHSRMAPNMLLYWSMMEEAIRRGAGIFNFGRCSPDSGTHRFKKQWGGEDHPLPWAQWSASGLSATPTPTGRKFELATAAWRRLPLPVANSLGPLLARKIP
jgi:FemAB-related protein (PEP-CTERM system-associated)